jgi:sporadic carbohydrate cluster 2OG-Fe(II) oxygenase
VSDHQFISHEEQTLIDEFLLNGFTIVKLEDYSFLDNLKNLLSHNAGLYLDSDKNIDSNTFLNSTQDYVSPSKLNDLRVHLINQMNNQANLLPGLYNLGKKYIDTIVGNELCIQRRGNLSIQLPHDESSLLPIHTDVWAGNSPYEVVFWVPLVDCHNSKSMYILPIDESQKVVSNFQEYSHLNTEELYQELKDKFVHLDVPYGSAVVFSHSLLHGNRVNLESESRWSINIRFKSALSPFGTKDLGETFLPINIRPATRIGFHYKKPIIKGKV